MIKQKLIHNIFAAFFIALIPFNSHAADSFNYDIDGNGKYEALTDGLLVIRYLFSFRGEQLISKAIGAGAKRTTPEQIETYIEDNLANLDIDGNGKTDPLTDGLILIRHLFGFPGSVLTANAIASDATRTTPEAITSFIETFKEVIDIFVNTPSSQICVYKYGTYYYTTYTFKGGITGTGTVSAQPYTGVDCTGVPEGLSIDDTITYSLTNISKTNDLITAYMTIVNATYGTSSRTVYIRNGIVSLTQ